MIYLDHNATSPLRQVSKAAMERAFELSGNPSSIHAAGRVARAVIEDAREKVAVLAGTHPGNVIFTSGGTEANALALRGAVEAAAAADARITRIFVSAIEHDSVMKTVVSIARDHAWIRVTELPVTCDGIVDVTSLRDGLREGKGRALVAVMAANNETGAIQPFEDVACVAREYGALLLVDAVQACGKIAIDTRCADYLSLSAHKLGGPQGVGALVVRDDAPLAAQLLGGGQERGARAGTENLIGIAGFGAAAEAVQQGGPNVLTMRDRFESALLRKFAGAVVFAANAQRVANTSNFALPGIAAETALVSLDLDGVMVSSGAACSSGKVKPSHVLKAMGVSSELANSALRVSFGWSSRESDVDALLEGLGKLALRVRARKAA